MPALSRSRQAALTPAERECCGRTVWGSSWASIWNLECLSKDRAQSAKRWGKRFQAVLADSLGRELGGPPHRASDLFVYICFLYICRSAWGKIAPHRAVRVTVELRKRAAPSGPL